MNQHINLLFFLFIILIFGYIVYQFVNTKKISGPNEHIFTFTYDERLKRYMIHGLWLNTKINCPHDEFVYPVDQNNFIKHNWYDRNLHAEQNSLFKYEYIKHGSCFNINPQEYSHLVQKLYFKYYDKYVLNAKTDKREIWLILDDKFNYVRSKYK